MADEVYTILAKKNAGLKLNKKLLLAAYRGSVEDIVDLVAHGADVNCISETCETERGFFISKGHTPLILAAEKGYIECLNKLIEYGADVDFVGELYYISSAMTQAALAGHDVCFYRLAELKKDLNCIESGSCLLSCLCSRSGAKYLRMAQFLMDSGVNMDYQDDKGMTPLMHAIKYGEHGSEVSIELVKSIIEHNANLLLKDNEGNSVMDYAAGNGDPTIQGLIISALEHSFMSKTIKEQPKDQDTLSF